MILKNPIYGQLMRPLSWPYAFGVGLRNQRFDNQQNKIRHLETPVISVGNLTVGGTGKTPMVIWLAETLLKMGKKPVILSRGYKRKLKVPVIVSDGEQIYIHPKYAGDEPTMIARRLSNVPVLVGSDRGWIGNWAEGLYEPDVFLLDDGFQHRRLHRDLDIVLVNARNPWGNGRLLPAGPLREPKSSLNRADIVIITHANMCKNLNRIIREIRKHTRAPILESSHQAESFVHMKTNEAVPFNEFGPRSVIMFSGIVNPDCFLSMLSDADLSVKERLIFGDHHWYEMKELRDIMKKSIASKSDAIVTTEKDAARIEEWPVTTTPFYYLRINLKIEQPENTLDVKLNGLFVQN